MTEFHALDWFEVKGRGSVAVIEKLPEGEYDPDLYKGKQVIIDGDEYTILGVETFAIPRSESMPYRHSFGLLVKAKNMQDKVYSKQVRRWYLNGKGYAGRKLAYKALAYRLLLDELLGEVFIETGYDGAGGSYEIKRGRAKLIKLDDTQAKAEIHDLFMAKFPHTDSVSCRAWCDKRYLGDGETEDGYVYDSCRAAQRDWIERKAEELINAEISSNPGAG